MSSSRLVLACILAVGGLWAPQVAAEADSQPWALHETDRGPVLLGEVTREALVAQEPEWQEEYAAYEPDSAGVAVLAGAPDSLSVLIVLGSWCGDSAREVPRFWKLLDEADNPDIAVRMIAIGRRSDEGAGPVLAGLGLPEDPRQAYDVEYVPTFIFKLGDRELGRIIESPQESLEADTERILAPVEKPASAPAATSWH
jgi:thiol-disulfide isomerase/thioredoxin